MAAEPTQAREVCPLKPGALIPDVNLRAADGKDVSLRQLVTRRPAVLVFYRGGWCPFCNRQLSELRTIQSALEKMGITLVAISPDRHEALAKTSSKRDLTYTLLSDADAQAIRGFGIAFAMEPAAVERLKSMKMDIEAASGKAHRLLPVPSVFLVGADRVVKFVYANPDYKVRIPGKLIVAAAEALLAKAGP
jgi:peroxiredoxin